MKRNIACCQEVAETAEDESQQPVPSARQTSLGMLPLGDTRRSFRKRSLQQQKKPGCR